MWTLKRGAAALAVAVVIALAVVIGLDRLDMKPAPDPAGLIAKESQYEVRIRRDTFGVPHILGKRDADVAFGLGYAHAEDDFATIQTVVLATRGNLAGRDGPKAAVTDYLVHLMRIWETIDALYDQALPDDLKTVMAAYADGVNDYAARHPDQVAPGLLPLDGHDVAAGFMFKTPFFYGLDHVLMQLTSPDAGTALSKTSKDAFLPTTEDVEIGSNGVAVAPSRSADGATRLLVNSHQPYTGPVAWYEAVLDSGEGWHVAGGFFPGSPFMLHGHNAHLGWANTVNTPDLVDVYKLELNPDNSNQYRLDGQWRDFEKSDAAIKVKLLGPLRWTFHRDVLWSAHGPVLKTDRGAFAIRYAGIGEIRQALQYYRLDKAQNLDDWRAAMALQALPSINYVYADEAGQIGYVYNGQFPIRADGVDWQGVLPGDRSDLIWHDYLPFDRLPQLWNPPSGFVFNSNNTPFQASAPEDDLKPEDFPANLGIQRNMTNRAWRALETFGNDRAITEEAFRRYKFDVAYSEESLLADIIADAASADPGDDKDLQAAQAILRQWDRSADRDSRGAALGVLTAEPVARAEEEGKPVPKPIEALQNAIRTLKQHFGRLDPLWGDVNRIRRGSLDLAIDGGPDTLRAVYGAAQDDGTRTAEGGDTLIMFVTWDKDGTLRSESIHQFGSATLDAASPHYADQTPLFVAKKTKPVWFTEAALSTHIEVSYRPGELH
jgi:penicillin amidase/acyl-homoserine-lactone acylase